MTPEEKAQINKQNAQHSTGPKTEEGKAKSAQNALTHGLSSKIPPLENPEFVEFLQGFIDERKPQTPSQLLWVEELAHVAWKMKQIPSLEYETELNSGLTLAQHFAQEKPTSLVKLWSLQLRLQGRFNSLDRKLNQNGCPVQPVSSPAKHPSAPSRPNLQNEPKSNAQIHVHKTPGTPIAPKLQNEPTRPLQTLTKLASAINSVPIHIPKPF
jgi:hypothetical protein